MIGIPNCISFCRIILCLSLIFTKPLSTAFYVIYILCGLSDMIDGFVARKTGKTSKFGAKLDSFADFIMACVLLVLLYPILNPGAVVILWVIVIGIIRLTSMGIAFKKYKSFASLHTYGNKITGFVLFLFPLFIPLIHLIVLMYLLCAIASLSAVEELLIHLTSTQLDLNTRSIFKK